MCVFGISSTGGVSDWADISWITKIQSMYNERIRLVTGINTDPSQGLIQTRHRD